MIFATDLDRTMIYSKRMFDIEKIKNVTLVETLDGKDITYMSNYALKELEELNKQIYVIPTTTRSFEQFMRIKTFKYCKYAIVANGGTILYNGKVLKEWEEHISDILKNYTIEMENMKKFLNNQSVITREATLVDGKFVFTKTDDIEKCEKILEEKLDKKLWNYCFQGDKVYIIPKEVTKSNAINYLKNLLNEKILAVAGDRKNG